MLDRKAIALNVENLTDARYFAALGVSHIAFSYDPTKSLKESTAKYKEIMDWCEGIEFLISYDKEEHIEGVGSLMEELAITGVVRAMGVSQKAQADIEFVMLTNVQGYTASNESILIMSGTKEEIERLAKGNNVFVALTEETVKMLIQKENLGLIVFGSDEEKVGYKSYDQLDDLLERMSID